MLLCSLCSRSRDRPDPRRPTVSSVSYHVSDYSGRSAFRLTLSLAAPRASGKARKTNGDLTDPSNSASLPDHDAMMIISVLAREFWRRWFNRAVLNRVGMGVQPTVAVA